MPANCYSAHSDLAETIVEKLNQWLTLAANLGVLAGIIFLALEIQQNTATMNRQAGVERTSRLMGPYVQDIPAIYEKVKAVDGEEPVITVFKDRYKLDTQEAVTWVGFLQSNWQVYESDFRHLGPSAELDADIRYMMSFPDNQLLWDRLKSSFDVDFVDYVESLEQR